MGGRHIFIGDIHGCIDEVTDVLRRVRVQRGDVVVALGDLVRKGPGVREVVATWMESGYLSVLGNNDAKLVTWARSPWRRLFANGADRPVMRDARAMRWLAGLPLVLDFPDIGAAAVHGGVLPNGEHFAAELAPRPAALELRYLRRDGGRWTIVPKGEERDGDPFWSEVWRGDRTVVYGHTPRAEPRVDRAAMGLDTGCVYGGALTAAVFDSRGRWTIEQVKARRRYAR